MITRTAEGVVALLEWPDPARVMIAHRHRHRLQIPDDAAPGHRLEDVIRDVDFPPVEALAGGARVMMVIVVPALAERDQCEKPVVAAGITGLVALRAEYMRQR